MNNGIDGNPQSLPVNATFSAYPWASWAARLRVDPSPEWNAQLGVYQVSNRTFARNLNGLNMAFEPTDGVMFVGQVGWTPEFLKGRVKGIPTEAEEAEGIEQIEGDMHGMPGHYWFGAYYSTWEYAQFGTTRTAANAYGFYWHADQTVYQESLGSDQGRTLWSAFVLSPQQNIARLPFQWNAGAVYQGLIPCRDNDSTILGLAYGNFSSDCSDAGLAYQADPASYELALEVGYRIQLNRFFLHPAGRAIHRAARRNGLDSQRARARRADRRQPLGAMAPRLAHHRAELGHLVRPVLVPLRDGNGEPLGPILVADRSGDVEPLGRAEDVGDHVDREP